MGFVNFLIKIGLDTTDVQLGTKRVESAFTGMGNKLASALSVTALAGFAKSLIDTADAIGDLAEQSGLAAKEVQDLQTVAGRSGVEVEKYIQALHKIGEARDKANAGDEKSQLLLGRFGVTAADRIGSASNLTLLVRVGEEFNKQKDSLSAQADAVGLVGARMAKVLSTIEGINKVGGTFKLGQFDVDELSRAKDSGSGAWQGIKRVGSAGLSALATFAEAVIAGGKAEYSDPSNRGAFGDAFMGSLKAARDRYRDSLKKKETGPDNFLSAEEISAGDKDADEKAAAFIASVDAKKKRDAKVKSPAQESLLFRSSNPDAGAAGGAFYFGADRGARLDLGRQSLDLQKQTLKEIQKANGTLASITTQ